MKTVEPGVWCDVDVVPGKRVWTDKAQRKRCPRCSKMLTTYAVYDHWTLDELIGFRLPPHKTKTKTYKRPKGDRGSVRGRRG